jgi:beta-lactam-binding protein with PASTA domain
MTTLEGLITGSGSSRSNAVGVPLLIGLTRTQAVQALESLGLTARVEDVETLGTVDTVYSQNPVPPASRNRGTEVIVQVITAPSTVPSADLDKRLEELSTAVAVIDTVVQTVDRNLVALGGKVETDAAATDRQKVILERLNDVVGKLTELGGKIPGAGPGA